MNISDEAVTAAGYAESHGEIVFDFINQNLLRAALEAAAPYLMAEALTDAAQEARTRGDVGKEDEGGIAAWDFLEWRAQLALRSEGARE